MDRGSKHPGCVGRACAGAAASCLLVAGLLSPPSALSFQQAAEPAPPAWQLAQAAVADAADAGVAAARADGLKAMVALGEFLVKAAAASQAIGDGLREMLISALHQSGYFVVVERPELRSVQAEQDPSDALAERAGAASGTGLDISDIMVFGAVVEFEPAAGGSSFMTPLMGVPLAMGAQIKWAQMALDVRVVDVRTGRVLAAQRIPGIARSAQGTIAGALPVGPVAVPGGLSVYRNTPMEWAVRDCLRKSVYFVVNSIDDEYFRHR